MYSKNDAKVVLFVLIYKQKTGLFDVCLKYIAYLCAFLKNLEMTKAELHKFINDAFQPKSVMSEYGMTELLSQAYSIGKGYFNSPPWMKIMMRDVNDPFAYVKLGKTGGINVIDLANIHSCSFIATQDLGRQEVDAFQLMGRFDHSDLRGCNLLVQ